jgi:mannosyltransferase
MEIVNKINTIFNNNRNGVFRTVLLALGSWRGVGRCLLLLGILGLATGLRFWQLGRQSLWYDEVVPMRLARQQSPAALLRLLNEIEATRAPLHPLVLEAWLRLFGSSDQAGRSLSAVCGVLTVFVVYLVARDLYDRPTALWSAGLASASPLLVRYSQEAKMYAWLVLWTCVSWALLLSLRRSASVSRQALYAGCLIALGYSHPLSVFMFAAHALAYLVNRGAYRLSLGRWLLIQVAVAAAVAAWTGHYVDHAPEIVAGKPTLRLLLGLPIGYVGGSSLTLLLFAAIVACGLLCVGTTLENGPAEGIRRPSSAPAGRWKLGLDHPLAASTLVIWFAVPPLLLFALSLVWHPLFGEARYTLYAGPAFLILLARGLVKFPVVLRGALGVWFLFLAAALLRTMVYAPDLKADWRGARDLLVLASSSNMRADVVYVLTEDPRNTVELETARYYLGERFRVLPLSAALSDPPKTWDGTVRWVVFATGLRRGRAVATLPASLDRAYPVEYSRDLPGLRLVWRRPRGAASE